MCPVELQRVCLLLSVGARRIGLKASKRRDMVQIVLPDFTILYFPSFLWWQSIVFILIKALLGGNDTILF